MLEVEGALFYYARRDHFERIPFKKCPHLVIRKSVQAKRAPIVNPEKKSANIKNFHCQSGMEISPVLKVHRIKSVRKSVQNERAPIVTPARKKEVSPV